MNFMEKYIKIWKLRGRKQRKVLTDENLLFCFSILVLRGSSNLKGGGEEPNDVNRKNIKILKWRREKQEKVLPDENLFF